MEVRNGRQHAELVKACADAHGVSARSVRNWREGNDKRWLDFLAAKAIERGEVPITQEVVEDEVAEPELPGEGLDFEIRRLKRECLNLAIRIRRAERDGAIALEATLHRIIDDKRETLRKLAKDEPGVAQAAGETVPKMVIAHYAADVCTLLQTLPSRISTLMPAELAVEIRQRVDAEITSILNLASSIQLRAA